MRARAFLKAVTVDRDDALERFLQVLAAGHVKWCLVGGLAVNAYAEPVVTLDLDLVVVEGAAESLVMAATTAGFVSQSFTHSTNLTSPGSDLRIQIQRDPRYSSFVDRAQPRSVLGLTMPVAAVEDVLQGKIWAFQDIHRRGSKRQKDLADIARLLETFPGLRERVPADVLQRLV